MKLVATLSGHFSEVTQVKWNSFMKMWVTASEDGTIRTWVSCRLMAVVIKKANLRVCLPLTLLAAVFLKALSYRTLLSHPLYLSLSLSLFSLSGPFSIIYLP